MTTFDDGLIAIKEAVDYVEARGVDCIVTFSRALNKFCVYSATEPCAGVFIERVRADAKA